MILIIAYLALSFYFLNYYRYQINLDGTSYISIAFKYLRGDFKEAVNGYWGPLYSWLIVPFLAVNFDGLLAAKLVNIFSGVILIFVISKILSNLEIGFGLSIITLLIALVNSLYFSMRVISPDLLLTAFLMIYVYLILREDFLISKKNLIFLGIVGAVSYLTKSFAFYFFLASLLLITSYLSFQERKIFYVKRALLIIVIFLVVSLPWIILISNKYQYLTLGTVGKYNFYYISPQSQGHPVDLAGIKKPPNNSAISSWEDPSYYKFKPWNPLASREDLRSYFLKIRENYLRTMTNINTFSLLSLGIIFACLLILLKDNFRPNRTTYLFILLMIYLVGYNLILVEERYLWFADLLILILGAVIFNNWVKTSRFNLVKKLIIYSLVLLISTKYSIDYLRFNKDQDQWYMLFAQRIKPAMKIDNPRIISNINHDQAINLTYYLKGQYYGFIDERGDEILYNQTLKNIKESGINYYFYWGDKSNLANQFIKVYQENNFIVYQTIPYQK